MAPHDGPSRQAAVVLLNGSNFEQWMAPTRFLLQTKSLWHAVEPAGNCFVTDHDNKRALEVLFASMDEACQADYSGQPNACQLWNILLAEQQQQQQQQQQNDEQPNCDNNSNADNNKADLTDLPEPVHLLDKICKLKAKLGKCKHYIKEFAQLVEQLQSASNNNTLTSQEDLLVLHILRGLPQEFAPMITRLFKQSQQLTLQSVKKTILATEETICQAQYIQRRWNIPVRKERSLPNQVKPNMEMSSVFSA